jgi:Zn-dependent protease
LGQLQSRRAKPATFFNSVVEPFMFFEPARTPFDLNFRFLGVWVRVHPMHWIVSVILGPPLNSGLVYVLAWVICVFLSVLLHEMGHIMMGRLFGSDGYIILYSFGGLAVPDQRLPKRYQRILVSFAGPLIQLILAGFLIAGWIAAAAGGYQAPPKVEVVLDFLLQINIFWAVLNLLPIWPLDGGRISREICTLISARHGVRASLVLSIVVSGFLAVTCLAALLERPILPYTEVFASPYMALFFASFALGSIMALNQEASARRERNDEPWRDPDDDGDAWKR